VKRFDPTHGDNPQINRLQSTLQESVGPLKDVAILDGKLVTADITTAGTIIPHGLGRSYKGYMIVRRIKADGTYFNGSIYEQISPDDSIYLKLVPTHNSTITAWVF